MTTGAQIRVQARAAVNSYQSYVNEVQDEQL